MPNNKNAKKNVSSKKPRLKKAKMVTKTITRNPYEGGVGKKTVTFPAKRKPKGKKIKKK